MDTFVIDNPLLKQAILGGTYCSKIPLRNCHGFLYDSGAEQIGRAFLEYCYSEIFNIRRFPGYDTYLANSNQHCKGLVEYKEIDDCDIEEACAQLKGLYEYTQHRLQGKSLELHRRLQDFEIKVLAQQSEKDMFMPANILTCYSYNSYNGAYRGYEGDVIIYRNVPAEDVVMIDSWTAYANTDNCSHKVFTGEGEVWVLNKDRFGRIPVKKEWIDDSKNKIHYAKKKLKEHEIEWRMTRDDGESLMQSKTFSTKPCELNDALTKWVMRRNERIIKKRGF